jgi:hypothetical protein
MKTLFNIIRLLHKVVLLNVIMYVCPPSLLLANLALHFIFTFEITDSIIETIYVVTFIICLPTRLTSNRFLFFNYSVRRFHQFSQYVIAKFSMYSIHCESNYSTILLYYTWNKNYWTIMYNSQSQWYISQNR